jgi:hypothetical protein
MIPAGRRASIVTLHAAQNMQAALCGASLAHGSRPYMSSARVSLDDSALFLKRTDEFRKFMQSQDGPVRAAEKHLKYPFKDIPNASAWLEQVKQVDLLVKMPQSPLRELDGDASLAFLLQLFEAGHECGADCSRPEFAVLSFNFHRLVELTFTESRKADLDKYARRVVRSFAGITRPCGDAFARSSAKERKHLLNQLKTRVATDAYESGLGLSEEDMLAMQAQPTEFYDELMLGAGACAIARDGTPVLALSAHLLNESAELRRRIEERGETADMLLIEIVDAIGHEGVHLAQYSSFSSVPADARQFKRRQVLLFSIACELALQKHIPHKAASALSAHETEAWYASTKMWAAFYRSTDMRDAAGAVMDNPVLQRRTAQIVGEEPRDFVTLDEPAAPAAPLPLVRNRLLADG